MFVTLTCAVFLRRTVSEISDGPNTIMYVSIGIVLTVIGLLALTFTIHCIGINHHSRTKSSVSDRVRGSGGRTGRRSTTQAASATKKLIKGTPGEKMRFRTIDVGRAMPAVSSNGSALVGTAEGTGGSSVSGAVKSNWLSPPAMSDLSPGTERTVSDMAGLAVVSVSVGSCGGSPSCSRLLRAVTLEEDENWCKTCFV